jgi:hypothetical protein
MSREIVHKYISQRRNHPAWLLLASPKCPLILASLKSLLEARPQGVEMDEAAERLAELFEDHANDSEFDLGDDHTLAARRELRQWIKRGLIVERGGIILATDAFQRAVQFVDSLADSTMTSTASRLATVQRAIEVLESQLSRNQCGREQSLQTRIDALVGELKQVQAGQFEVLDGPKAEEGIREVYQLAVSLQADFRRVEDSYRQADQQLRQRIISEQHNRGEIVDELLSGHEMLVNTTEGQVFESFYSQLVKTAELEEMKRRLRLILENQNCERALKRRQRADLQQLVARLLQESARVIQARARSERDVRGFLKSGLADEQMRVGAILQELLRVAAEVDWSSQKVRRSVSPLPPIAVSLANLPLVERLLPKHTEGDVAGDLELTLREANPAAMDDEFWQAYHALNRAQLFDSTIAHLRKSGLPLTIGALAKALPPTHDLETLAYWLAMAREAGIPIENVTEMVDLRGQADGDTRFYVPAVQIQYESVKEIQTGSLE